MEVLDEQVRVNGSSLVIERQAGNTTSRVKLWTEDASAVEGGGKPASAASKDVVEVEAEIIFGIFHLSNGAYLALVTASEEVPVLAPLGWRKIKRIELLPLRAVNAKKLARSLEREGERELKLLCTGLQVHTFYYSATHDITQSLQRQLALAGSNGGKQSWGEFFGLRRAAERAPESQWRRADERFFWNRNILSDIIACGAGDLAVPVLNAFVGVAPGVSVEGPADRRLKKRGAARAAPRGADGEGKVDVALISRRGTGRQGVRFACRGADDDGHTANFVESEQLVLPHGRKGCAAFVQTRGSIPLLWSSPSNFKYRPKVAIVPDGKRQAKVLGKHLQSLEASYGAGGIVIVNLIDKHGDQGRLGRHMSATLQAAAALPERRRLTKVPLLAKALPAAGGGDEDEADVTVAEGEGVRGADGAAAAPSVKHVWFDFHANCRKMQWGNLARLVGRVSRGLERQGFALVSDSGRLLAAQSGVHRVNCMDSLDRTNVVQSVFARRMLLRQLRAFRIISAEELQAGTMLPGEGVPDEDNAVLRMPFPALERAYRRIWSENADEMSMLYAGTPALKGDFTRTGKRTPTGALKDGFHSAVRYYINNFLDEDRQDAIDILLG